MSTHEDRVDTRAKVFIYYQSGAFDSLCMSGTPAFLLNGKYMMSGDDSLLDLMMSFQANIDEYLIR